MAEIPIANLASADTLIFTLNIISYTVNTTNRGVGTYAT